MSAYVAVALDVLTSMWMHADDPCVLQWMASALFGCVVLVDLLLTGTLITVLLRSRTGFSR